MKFFHFAVFNLPCKTYKANMEKKQKKAKEESGQLKPTALV